MKRLFLLTILLLTLCAGARATTITISSFSPGLAWRYGGTTATLRISNSQGFLSSDGVWIPASTSTNFYKNVTCSISSTTITCASFTLDSTTNGNPSSARYKFQFFGPGTANTPRDVLFSNFQVPTILGTTITIGQLVTFNQAAPAPPRPGFPDIQQVQALVNIAVGTLNDASDVVKGRTKLSVAPASASSPIAVGANDARITQTLNVKSYGVTCDGVTDDATNAQAALDAAKAASHVNLVVPHNCQLKIGTKLQLNAAVSVIFGTDQPEAYADIGGSARIIWAGSSGGTMMEALGSAGCRFQGLAFTMGTANIALDIDTGSSGVSTSNTVFGVQFNKDPSNANTIGLGISRTSSVNNERMSVFNTACFFGGSTTASNVNRGTCIQIGSATGGVNAKNTFLQNTYWFGASYGVVLWHGDLLSINGESNFATIDYLDQSGDLIVIGHYTEGARQFAVGRFRMTLLNNKIKFGGWDNAFPLIYASNPGSTSGSGFLTVNNNAYDLQSGVNAVDADSSGTYYINADALNIGNNEWPNGTPSVGNFSPGRTFLSIPTLRGTEFALLAVWLPPSGYATQIYCVDCLEGSDPCTGSSSGAMASYIHGRWKCQ